jgi:hypothetical protein
MNRERQLRKLVAILLIPASISLAHADVGDILTRFQPYLGLQEVYSDNINLTATDRKDDFITTISPGFRFSTSPPTSSLISGLFNEPAAGPGLVVIPGQLPTLRPSPDPSGVDLNYLLGLVFYAKNSELNYVSHQGRLNAWHAFNPDFTLGLRDYFIRSEEPRERDYTFGAPIDQFFVSVQRERAVYTRNVFEPTAAYRFGPEDLFTLYYLNNIYQTQSSSSEDSQENFISPRLSYWFNLHNGIALEYGLMRGEFERSPDQWGQMPRARYTYRFDPNTSIFGEYIYIGRDFDPPGRDYEIHNPSVGIQHAFGPTLTGIVQAGYFRQNLAAGPSADGPTYNVGLTGALDRTTYVLSFQGGYREDYFTSQNLGFTRYYRSLGRIFHRFTEGTTCGLVGSYEVIEYGSRQKDNIWRILGNASYSIFNWLTLSLTVGYQENDSTVATAEYRENRVELWIVAYP